MLDGESPISAEIMNAIISRDFCFSDLKYSGRTDPLINIEHFNDITRVQGLSQAQRCRVFPLSLEGRACECTGSFLEGVSSHSNRCARNLQSNFGDNDT